ncbi:uncharacterized protein EV154DRAFT_495119 [Mucor mucedo]|uniref:uncharacterized protein n=1 Tax=Mucor mucedo TaxID=29922 RepID=UPI00221E76F8|nr:uncharacterized protein EV154DRAFT_495119 [Mucor mucedo]KAI7895498.1 hypothetical protein EV154DRAFT_495119 [Mucor mucedo]
MDAPWSSKETLETKDRLERLSKEIVDFVHYIEPTKEEQLNRDTLMYQVSTLIETLWPNNTVITAFGSSVTGLAFPASDIDINIDFEEMPKKNRIDVLKIIRKQTINQHIFEYPTTCLAANAKVPVLMAVDGNDVSMDITIQNVCFSSDRTAAWIKEYPPLKPLFMVLKQSIGNFRLSHMPTFEPLSAKYAGLASYSLICLIVSYLQQSVPKDVNPTRPNYLASLLLGFLSFYSTFESDKKAIGLTNGGCFYDKKDCPIPLETKKGKLTIIDPDVPGVNVARSTLKFDRIQYIFKQAYDMLLKQINTSGKSESILSSLIKVEHHAHTQPRKQGIRFKAGYTWIETGEAQVKSGGGKRFGYAKRFGGGKPYVKQEDRQRRGDERYEEGNRYRDEPKSRYQRTYKAEPYSKRFEDYNDREYQRHKRNNNSHLAEHYKYKSRR